MRHKKSGRKLGRTAAHRRAMLSNMAAALITYKRIKTTDPRAKELRRYIEPLITFAKRGDLHARRQVLKKLHHKNIVNTLFSEIAPVYANRNGGYTRIIKLGFRDNDRAPISLIELVDIVGTESTGEDKKSKPKDSDKASEPKEKKAS
ncbi:MAG: 50S ribosomal protein L17 [Candidatus Marinimicrobia bacterium]|nr:50S ribosomal protein L17 [Candidatus Neomarinimicrobiota bacterium]